MKRFIPPIVVLALLAGASWKLGIFPKNHVQVDKGAFWPAMGYGGAYVFIWRNGDIVYLDNFDWTPHTYDSLKNVHLRKAQDFINSKN